MPARTRYESLAGQLGRNIADFGRCSKLFTQVPEIPRLFQGECRLNKAGTAAVLPTSSQNAVSDEWAQRRGFSADVNEFQVMAELPSHVDVHVIECSLLGLCAAADRRRELVVCDGLANLIPILL